MKTNSYNFDEVAWREGRAGYSEYLDDQSQAVFVGHFLDRAVETMDTAAKTWLKSIEIENTGENEHEVHE